MSVKRALNQALSQSHPSPRPSPREGRGRNLLLKGRPTLSPSPLNGERAGVRGAIGIITYSRAEQSAVAIAPQPPFRGKDSLRQKHMAEARE